MKSQAIFVVVACLILLLHNAAVLIWDVDMWMAGNWLFSPLSRSAICVWVAVPPALVISFGNVLRNNHRRLFIVALILLILGMVEFLVPFQYDLPKPQSAFSFYLRRGRQIQEKVEKLLETPHSELDYEERSGMRFLDTTMVPQTFGLKEPSYLEIDRLDPTQKHIVIIYGSGFGHWGIAIGSRSFVFNGFPCVKLWDGFYCFHD